MEYVTVDGVDVPVLGFGTAGMDSEEERRRAITAALATGYRHVDTAQMYDSESAVGDAVDDADVAREELFVTTKLSRNNRHETAVVESTHDSLNRLGMEYVDLLLIHSPEQDVPHEETLDAMNDLVDDGAVRHIGVSNFSVEQTRNAIEHSTAPILTNQVEYSLATHQPDLFPVCIEEDVLLTAYSPLKLGAALDNDSLGAIAETHGKTVRQVAIRWLLQQPMVTTIPRSSNPDHIERNADVFDFELSDEEMTRLFEIGGGIDEDLAARIGL